MKEEGKVKASYASDRRPESDPTEYKSFINPIGLLPCIPFLFTFIYEQPL